MNFTAYDFGIKIESCISYFNTFQAGVCTKVEVTYVYKIHPKEVHAYTNTNSPFQNVLLPIANQFSKTYYISKRM
jgi:hypothetical protein